MATKKYQYQQPQPQEPAEGWGHIPTEAEKEQQRLSFEKAAEEARKKREMERTIRLCTAIASSIIITQDRLGNNAKSGTPYAPLY